MASTSSRRSSLSSSTTRNVEGVTRPAEVAGWIRDNGIAVLNVAGNRENVNPGIGERVEAL